LLASFATQIEIDPVTGAFNMQDASRKNITTTTSLLASPAAAAAAASIDIAGGNGSTCATVFPNTDASNPQRTPKYPNGIMGATQASCCAACDGDPDCTFWVFALPSKPDPSGQNCWLLRGVTATFSNDGRISGGSGPLSPSSPASSSAAASTHASTAPEVALGRVC